MMSTTLMIAIVMCIAVYLVHCMMTSTVNWGVMTSHMEDEIIDEPDAFAYPCAGVKGMEFLIPYGHVYEVRVLRGDALKKGQLFSKKRSVSEREFRTIASRVKRSTETHSCDSCRIFQKKILEITNRGSGAWKCVFILATPNGESATPIIFFHRESYDDCLVSICDIRALIAESYRNDFRHMYLRIRHSVAIDPSGQIIPMRIEDPLKRVH
jgi:hypothetical protein